MILDEIAAKRSIQLRRERDAAPLAEVKKAAERAPAPKNFKAALQKRGLSVIAEVKKASPSKGLIRPDFHPAEIAARYEAAGADALSVLTEEAYFQGSSQALREARAEVKLPILRKDFIVSPYQIYEARAIGADAILLIAAILDTATLKEYKKIADSLGLASLLEAHTEEELEKVLAAGAEIVGINNRDLTTFRVDLGTAARLAKLVPPGRVLVSESGVASRADMETAARAGADAVLIGETLMRSGDPAATLRELRGEP
ncbi:MAG: indole-3-glycerol phosphate synthase TrpC [Oscillospiraceae bacterium]|jgi:indole-3-glycerol phosphate synthase|nr:indole-3-glycerol phosphate synthase TrpC [Oscillospiraceae bacterium]MCI1989967.1 indole-3-glycerol phosphate synthase TrpC [Oscillospiraceae bacterium]MCI2034997.1 indole-3-glycerol phosphate synthase TrpC [Oscillospiraceae bacterium]